jgi:drug/metabolite transporter (DMT)-like permease
VGLTEVLFAVVFAWLLLGELPRVVQLAGGVLIVGGVVAVRVGEMRRTRAEAAGREARDADFALPAAVA